MAEQMTLRVRANQRTGISLGLVDTRGQLLAELVVRPGWRLEIADDVAKITRMGEDTT